MQMTNHSIHQSELDIIELESKHQKQFERTQAKKEFSKNYKDRRPASFAYGKYDGEVNLEPEPYQWFDPIYRMGYFAGITTRFNELFSA